MTNQTDDLAEFLPAYKNLREQIEGFVSSIPRVTRHLGHVKLARSDARNQDEVLSELTDKKPAPLVRGLQLDTHACRV